MLLFGAGIDTHAHHLPSDLKTFFFLATMLQLKAYSMIYLTCG